MWTDNISDELYFKLERSTDELMWEAVAYPPASQTSGDDVGLTQFTTYFYRISAVNLGGDGPASATASATTLAQTVNFHMWWRRVALRMRTVMR
jgi:peptidyl-Asp metalloendopeptidase